MTSVSMQLLSLIVIAELAIGLIIAPMSHRHNLKNSSYRATILLAEDAAPAPADSSSDSSSDSGGDASGTDSGGSDSSGADSGSADSSTGSDSGGEANPQGEPNQDNANQEQPSQEQPNPESENVSPEQPNTQEQANPEDNSSANQSENQPAENQPAENQTNENLQTESAPEEQNTNNPAEEFSSTESAALTDLGTNTNPENIEQTYVDKAQDEDSQLAQAETPAETVPLLIDFANDKINDVGTLIENNDFTSANFTLQRINEQVDQALADLGGLDNQESAPLKQELIKFSEEADSVFRWQQLVVPENLEQDFEISRGQFLNIEQIK